MISSPRLFPLALFSLQNLPKYFITCASAKHIALSSVVSDNIPSNRPEMAVSPLLGNASRQAVNIFILL